MGALTEERCSACGKNHKFYHPGCDILLDRARYRFECPTNKVPATFQVTEWNEANAARPAGAVIITENDRV